MASLKEAVVSPRPSPLNAEPAANTSGYSAASTLVIIAPEE
jgi:hypothetical protein